MTSTSMLIRSTRPACGHRTDSGPCVLTAGHPGQFHRVTPRTPVEHARARQAPASVPSRAWMTDAACTTMDPEVFFPDSPGAGAALAACTRCPVRSACLVYALDTGELRDGSGVWGGLPPAARRALLQRKSGR